MLRIAVACIALVATLLRLRGYTQNQTPNADEYDWAWSGLTLIEHHIPTGWTDLVAAYPIQTDMTWQGSVYNLVTPYLDHPPLFSLLVGGISWLAGARELTDVSLAVIRLVPIALSVAAIVLIFVLVRSLLGPAAALVSAGLIAISPTAITLSRVTESEALLVIWLLLALIALQRLDEDRSRRPALVMLLVCCALAPLTKVPGVVVGGIAFVVLMVRRDLQRAILVGLATMAGFVAYVLYGGFLDAALFSEVWRVQAQRHTDWLAGYELVRAGFADWWWILGVAGLALLALRNRRAAILITWPVLGYLLVISATASSQHAVEFAWYRIPIEGLIYTGAAWMVTVAAREFRAYAPPKSKTSTIPT